MNKIFIFVSLSFLGACASKKIHLGDEYKFKEDDCEYVPASSKVTVDRKEFTGESWPDRARTHSWDTALGAAMANCESAAYKDCRHVVSKDTKLNTGKDSGPGQFYYQVTVVGKKVLEANRTDEEIKRDACQALDRCVQKRVSKGDSDSDLKKYRDLQKEKSCISAK